jgi:hypothetical protein
VDPLIKSQLLYHLSYAPVFEDRHQSEACILTGILPVQSVSAENVDNFSGLFFEALTPHLRSKALMTIGIQLIDIILHRRFFRSKIVHQPNRSLDDMT